MGNTAITGEQIWWSQNDIYGSGVGGSTGDGKRFLEVQYRKKFGPASLRNSYLITGGTLPATDPDLTITVGAGSANLDGHFVQWPATNVTLPDNTTNWLFLKLVYSGGLVTGLEIEDNTTGVIPASSLQLGSCTTSSGAMTAGVAAGRVEGPGSLVVYTSSGTFTVNAGQYRAKIRIWSAGGGGGGGQNGDGFNGSTGGNGGTTSVGSLISANGGGGGAGGGSGGAVGAHATTTTGQISIPQHGMLYGFGGGGVGGGASGQRGGLGLYAESLVSLTPGATHTVTIGAGGTSGPGGSGGAGPDGGAGEAGTSARVVIEYLS